MIVKIGFISTHEGSPWGGSEELWYKTAKFLLDKGIQVGANVTYWSPLPTPIIDLINSGCSVSFRKNIQCEKGQISLKKQLIEKIKNKIKRLIFRKSSLHDNCYLWLDDFKPNLVVISQGSHFQGIAWKRHCLRRAIPYVSLVHLVSELQGTDDRMAGLLREVYRKAMVNYCVSESNVYSLEKLIGAKLENNKVVRNSFKVPYDANLTYPSTEPFFKLAVVASLNPLHKGQDMLFEVLRQDKWRERPLKVSLYGKGVNEKLLKRLKQLWQLEMVEFKGFAEDITQIWLENHGLLMGSRMEGLPLALVEAMLCQRIAIVPDIAGYREVIRDNENGFLAKASTPYFLDEAMERAWQRREDWQVMGEIAARDIRKLVPADPAKVFANELMNLL